MAALLDAAQEPHRVGRAACWAGATVMMSEHFAWILVPATAAIVLTRPHRVRASVRLGAAALGAAAISTYLLVAPVLAGASPAGPLTQLTAYRTQADPRVGLLVNVAGLYGFFRPGPTEPKDLFSRWPAVLAALVLIVAVGYVAVLRDAAHRRDGLAILAAGIAGYFLALGDQGPTDGLFRLAYEHIPGFVVMREPDKFAVLVALAYAYGFGWGISWLTTGSRQKAAQVAPAALAIALPFAYTPNLFGGLGGQIKASEVPSSWASPRALPGRTTVLFLPWHEYFPTPFTGHRTIANPAASYFAGTVLTSQNPGPGYAFAAEDPEHVFLDNVLGPPVDLQRMRVALADLGVRFVALAKVADWRDFAQVGDVPGIRLVYSSSLARPLLCLADRRRRHATTAGCVPLTSSTTGSFPAIQVLSPSPFPTRKAGHSTAIRPYGSPTGKRVSSRPQEEVSFITARPAASSRARSRSLAAALARRGRRILRAEKAGARQD